MALAQNLENPTVQHLKPLVSDDSLAWRNLVSTPLLATDSRLGGRR